MKTSTLIARCILVSLALLACTAAGAAPLHLVFPNGGERFRVGSQVTIRWEGVAATDAVTLEYSTNNGASWNLITNAATGLQYVWTRVPNTPSTRCLMRVSTAGTPGDTVLYLKSSRSGFSIPEAVHFAEFSPDGSRVIGGGAEGNVYIWDSFTGQILMIVPVESRSNIPSPPATPGITLISCVHYSPDGKLFVTTGPLPDSTGSMVRVFDAVTGTKLREWRDVGISALPATSTFAFSPDGTRIIVCGQGRGTIYRVADGSVAATLAGYTAPLEISSMDDADWRHDGAEIIGASTNSQPVPDIIFSDPTTGAALRSFNYPGRGTFYSIRYSPDGTRFITAASDGAVRVYDAATGAVIYDIHDYATFPTSAAFSHDGQRFASTGQDLGSPNWRMRLYDAATGNGIRIVGAIINGMRTVDFSPDDARLLTACIDGVRIFRTVPGSAAETDVSDSLWEIYIDTNASVVVAAPVVTGRQGDVVDVPITISDPGAALGAGATRIDLELSYNVSLLDPMSPTPRGSFSGNTRTIPLSFPISSAADTVLGVLHFRAALGNDSTTILALDSVAADNANVAVADRDGLFRLADLCREGGPRLLNPNGTVALKLVSAGRDGIDADIETVESGPTSLVLCDVAGRTAKHVLEGEAPPGPWRAHIATGDLPQGRYFLVLRTPTVRKMISVEVVR